MTTTLGPRRALTCSVCNHKRTCMSVRHERPAWVTSWVNVCIKCLLELALKALTGLERKK